MRVAVLYVEEEGLPYGEPEDAVAVQADSDAAAAVTSSCRALGWEAWCVAFEPPSLPDADVVVNLVEGRLEPVAAERLDRAGVAFTGSSSWTLLTARDKPRAREVLATAGVPVPGGCVLATGDEPLAIGYPAVVKPAHEDASHGIGTESVVADEAAARGRARYVIERYRQPALVEEFLPGAEYGVSLLDGEVLPLARTVTPSGIVTYAAKWLSRTDEYVQTRIVPCDDAPAVTAAARAACDALGVRDYGRVDVRLSAAGEPFVIDVNPNPDLSPDAGLALAAARAALSHADVVERIVKGALARAARAATAPA